MLKEKLTAVVLGICLSVSGGASLFAEEAQGAPDREQQMLELIRQLEDRRQGADGVESLLNLKDPRVKFIFQYVQDRDLYLNNDLVLGIPEFTTNADGRQVAETAPLLGDPEQSKQLFVKDELHQLRAARKARKAINRALSVVDLYSDNFEERLNGVMQVGNKRVVDAMPMLREMESVETNPKMKRAVGESLNLLILETESDNDKRVAAIERLGELNSIRGLDELRRLLKRPNVSEEVRDTLRNSIESIESHQSFAEWTQHAFSGLSLASILLLTSLGLAVTFGLMGVINMAHGEMLMIGAVTAWACYEFIGTALPEAWFNWYYVIAIPMSFLVAAGVGVLIEIGIVRFLYKRPLDSMLATIGVSYILIQAVRSWKGDNLGMTAPSWFSGGWEIMQDVVLPYNRLFIIVLTIVSVLLVMALFRYTRFGLMLRATVQNRAVAAANGVNTRMVDMLTFGLGSGLAGIAGCALVLLTNPTPGMGQTYIVKSFLVTVVAGVGSLAGVIYSALGIGFLEKFIEPLHIMDEPIKMFDSTWAQVFVLILVIIFMQRRPGGLFPERGRHADRADAGSGTFIPRIGKRGDMIGYTSLLFIGGLLLPVLYLVGAVSPEFVTKMGYILTFAICAIGLDLLWGYTGVLSLCQALFFALGAYCMGLYLINHGPKDVDGIPQSLSYVMSDVSNRQAPWFMDMFQSMFGAVSLGILIPGFIALIIGLTTFRSRVKGVYFAILTQAITVGANLVFMKNDLKLGGTNGLTKFDSIAGAQIAYNEDASLFAQTRFWLYMVTLLVLVGAIALSRKLANGGMGRVLIAARDDETRLRFYGYQIWAWKTLIFVFAAMLAAAAGMLYVPQKGIINPHQMLAEASIIVVAWVAVGGRGTVWGAVLGAIAVALMYDWITSFWPQGWKFVLGAMFVIVPLVLPGGLLSLCNRLFPAAPQPEKKREAGMSASLKASREAL